jgi:hypothetical protein
MERLKYIIDEHGNFAIFSDVNLHSDMAKGFHFKPVSAGFCTIDIGYKIDTNGKEETIVNVHCFGESISLKLKGREEDEKIINSLIQH